MPTKEQIEELFEETNNKWVENFNNSGVNGYKFISKLDSSKYIFLPAAGFCNDFDLGYVSVEGRYWSSSLDTGNPNGAYSLYFDHETVITHYGGRYYGFSVRPVINL